MVSALIESPEVKQAVGDKRPVVAVFGLVDLTSEGVDIASLNSGILNDLNRAARFRFADSAALGDANEQLNPNLYDLLENPAASKGLSQAVSADYLLIGEISNLVRTHPQSKEVYYRVSLKLVDAQSDQFLWQENREFLKSQKKVVHGI
jgi:TolB-like protein